MSHESQLKNPKYRSWVKSGLGLKYLKEGLEHFTMEIMDEQHQAILMTVRKSSKSPSCNQCQINTVQPSHVRTKTNHCPMGVFECNCRQPKGKRPCLENVCSAIYDQIISIHGSTPPAPYWRNTNTSLWCTHPWEVAKCFINAPGYANTTSATDTDCAGLLHLIVNNKGFHSHLNCDITGSDVFCKTRHYRNEILHSPTMELENEIADTYIDDMIAVLKDPKELSSRPESTEAVGKLTELKQKDLIISTQSEMDVIKEMRDAIGKLTEESLEELKVTARDVDSAIRLAKTQALGEIKTTHDTLLNVNTVRIGKKADDALQGIVSSASIQQQRVTEVIKNAESDFILRKNEALSDMKSAQFELLRKHMGVLDKKVDEITETVSKQQISVLNNLEGSGKQQVKAVESMYSKKTSLPQQQERAITNAPGHKAKTIHSVCLWKIYPFGDRANSSKQSTNEESDYEMVKQVFKQRLIDLYMETVVKASVIPLNLDRDEASINELYVTPWLTSDGSNRNIFNTKKKEDKLQSSEAENISFLYDILHKNSKWMKLIYLIGDAGSGKSAFCKNMIHEWCTAHSGDKEVQSKAKKVFTKTDDVTTEQMSDKEILKTYEFLFYVSLRHNTESGDIRTMLNDQYEDPVLDVILENESKQCLVLLDGLDEWKPPAGEKSSQFQTIGLPKRDRKKQYTVITTSRPWKVEVLKIKESEIDNKIKLRGIEYKSVIKLAKSVVNHLNKVFEKNKSANRFLAKYVLSTEHTKCPLDDFIKSPVMLQQLVCLWFDGKLKQLCRFDIYGSMLELSVDWSVQRNADDRLFDMFRKESLAMDDICLPFALEDYSVLEEYKFVIFNAGKIAYHTLFSEQREASLTFGHTTLRKLGATKDFIQCCLNMGILTEEKSVTFSLSKRQNTQFSFTHKSIQEVLAAIYVVMKCQSVYTNDSNKEPNECILTYFENLKTAEDVLEQSNVMEIICGLSPVISIDVSKYIYDIVKMNESFIEFRRTLTDWRNCSIVSQIQELIFGCITEFKSNGSYEAHELYLADVIIRHKADIVFLSNIRTTNILSITIAGEIWGLSRSSIHLSKYDVKLLCSITDQRSTSLQRFSKTDSVTTDALEEVPVYCALIASPYRQLKALELKDIKIPHENMFDLSPFLEQNTNIQVISLIDIHCDVNQCGKHDVNLSALDKLHSIHIDGCSFSVTGLNTTELTKCYLSGQNIYNIFHFLTRAPVLERLHLASISFNDSHTFISGLQRLKCIEMFKILWSKTAWLSFIDCLKTFCSLQKLSFNSIDIPDEIRSNVLNDLQVVKTVENLDLKNMNISLAFPRALKDLRQLSIHNVTCFSSDAHDFVDSLQYLYCLENLVIRNMDLQSFTFSLPDSLIRLTHIGLNNVKLEKETWLEFAHSLKHLRQFESLELRNLSVPDKVLSFLSDMQNIRSICFVSVLMSLPTWIEIVDNLSSLPQPIEVHTVDLYIQDGTSTAAVEYVKQKKGLFQVDVKFGVDCNFKTKNC